MSKPVSGLNVFQNQAGPIPLSQLDANFTTDTNALNDLATYSNYFVDSSGAANTITVTVAAPLTFAYVTGIGLQVKLAFANTSATVNINVNVLGNKTVINNDGTALLIGQLVANSILSLMYDGTSFRLLSQSSSTISPVGLFPDGTAGSPSISFASDQDSGFYHVAANQPGVAAAGARVWSWSTTSAFALDGAAGTPAVAFDSDADTGLWKSAANTIAFGGNGIMGLSVDGGHAYFADGTGALPGGAFNADPDTGFVRNTTNSFAITAGGSIAAVFTTQGFGLNQDGSAASPGWYFNNDIDTGWYRDTANQIAIALGGVTAGQIAQGTFTGTLNGASGATGTINYQRVGNMVRLWATNPITGTGSTTSFTITGLPAVILPTNTYVTEVNLNYQDNSVIAAAIGVASGSGLSFQKLSAFNASSSVGWTAAGTKGISTGWTMSYPIS